LPRCATTGHYLVDGGAINNVPGNVLREQGVERVLGINCTPLEDNSIREYLIETNLFQLLKPGDKFWSNLKRVLQGFAPFCHTPPDTADRQPGNDARRF
jgi:predicted acylesterase/phospholipase RssA